MSETTASRVGMFQDKSGLRDAAPAPYYNPRVVHFVYIVRCADGSFYTGYARDPKARLKMHNAGAGAKYTRGRRPVKLVYSEAYDSLSLALKREYELKQWPRAKKRQLTKKSRPIVR
jgi:putative endonuclease